MRLVVDLPNVTFQRLERLLRKAECESLNQAIVAAIETHLTLSEGEPGNYVLGGAEVATAPSQVSSGKACPSELPATLRVDQVGNVSLASMPTVDEVSSRKYHLFGINRLAPLKVGIRALAALLSDRADPLKLSDFRDQASEVACELGDWLRAADDLAQRSRTVRMSAGFPRSGPTPEETEASKGRYAFFVLGNVQKKNKTVDGALFCLRLMSIEPENDGEGIVRITGPGLQFARLPSPLLDNPNGEPEIAFSLEEADWYLKHVAEHVPDEMNTLCRFLKYIHEGARRPRDAYEAMRQDYADISDNARANVRACVVGRLLDLRLASRTESQEYLLTERGLKLLEGQ